MVWSSIKTSRAMKFWLSSESPPLGFHVFRRMGPKTPYISSDLPTQHSNFKETFEGQQPMKGLKLFAERLRHRPKWLRSQNQNSRDEIEDLKDEFSFVSSASFGFTNDQESREASSVAKMTIATSSAASMYSGSQESIQSYFTYPGEMGQFLVLRAALRTLSLEPSSLNHCALISYLMLIFSSAKKAINRSGVSYTNPDSNTRESTFLMLMAQKVKDLRREASEIRLSSHESRLRLVNFFKQQFSGLSRQFLDQAQRPGIRFRSGSGGELSSLSTRRFSHSSFLSVFTSRKGPEKDESKRHEVLDSSCPTIYLVRGVQDIIEDVAEFCYFDESEKEFDTMDFSTFTSYCKETVTTESDVFEPELPVLRSVSIISKASRENGGYKNYFQFYDSDFDIIDYVVPSETPHMLANKLATNPEAGWVQIESHQTPEVEVARMSTAVQNVATPRNAEWDDPAWIVACLDFAIPDVARFQPQIETVGISNENTFLKNSEDDSFVTSPQDPRFNIDLDLLEKERLVSPEAVPELNTNIDVADSGSVESILLNAQLIESGFIGDDEDNYYYDNDQEALSWAPSPLLRVKERHAEVYEPDFMVAHADFAATDSSRPASINPDIQMATLEENFDSLQNSPLLQLTLKEKGVDSPSVDASIVLPIHLSQQPPLPDLEFTPLESSAGETLRESPMEEPNLETSLLAAEAINPKLPKTVTFSDSPNEEPYCSFTSKSEFSSFESSSWETSWQSDEGSVSNLNWEQEVDDEEYLEHLSDDDEETFLIEQLLTINSIDSPGDTETYAAACWKEFVSTTLLWTKTGLLFLEFRQKTATLYADIPKKIELVELQDESFSGSDSSGSVEVLDEIPARAPGHSLSDHQAIMDLTNEMRKLGTEQNKDEVQCLMGIINNYRRVFIHLINNVVAPCNAKIGTLVKEVLSIRKRQGEFYSLGSGINNEISIISESLRDNDEIDCAYWQGRLKKCHAVLLSVDSGFAGVQKKLTALQEDYTSKISDIGHTISRIRVIRDRILQKYYLFYEPNHASGSFGSQNVHRCTHVDDYKQSTMWHCQVDSEEFQALLEKDVKALISSNDAVGHLMSSVHEDLVLVTQAMRLYESIKQYRPTVDVIDGASPHDVHSFASVRSDSPDSWTDESPSKRNKRKRRRNKAKKSKRPKAKK